MPPRKKPVHHRGRQIDVSKREGESVPEYRYRLRLLVLRHYCGTRGVGCQCDGCAIQGERYLPFLQLDHVAGHGASHFLNGRRLRGFDLVTFILRKGFPRGMFAVKCANCNISKQGGTRNRGRCALYGTSH